MEEIFLNVMTVDMLKIRDRSFANWSLVDLSRNTLSYPKSKYANIGAGTPSARHQWL